MGTMTMMASAVAASVASRGRNTNSTDVVVKEGRTFVIGDIHGAHKALVQCLERCKFDNETDTLISLGDIADGWTEVYECVDELLKIKNLIAIRGNHDEWFLQWIEACMHPVYWNQGGIGTLKSYGFNCLGKEWDKFKIHWNGTRIISNLINTDLPESHINFFKHQINYFVDDENRMFVHGGFDRHYPIQSQEPFIFYWDRDLWNSALGYEHMIGDDEVLGKKRNRFKMKDEFTEVFIGHTTTMSWGKDTPMKAANIWNIDTGAGFKGRLTIMNVDTKEFFQSDLVQNLYPNEKGRG